MVMCRVISCVVGRGCFAFSWQNSLSLWSASFCTPRPNLPFAPGISWLPTFAFQSPVMKRTSFFFLVLVLEDLLGLHWTIQLQLSQHYWLGHRLRLLWYWTVEIILSFFRLHPNNAFQILVDFEVYSISYKGFLPTVVDVMVIWIKFAPSGLF